MQIDEDCNDYTVEKSPATLPEATRIDSATAEWRIAGAVYTNYEHSTDKADYKLTRIRIWREYLADRGNGDPAGYGISGFEATFEVVDDQIQGYPPITQMYGE